MERRGITTPLLIGGATTSQQHTAVKIAPEYTGATVHVLDASRAVDVVSSLLSDRQRDGVRRRQSARTRPSCARSTARGARAPLLTLADARANHLKTDWDNARDCRRPGSSAAASSSRRSRSCVPFIDWTFFFSAWELKGRFPAILDHPEYGAAARELYDHAQALLTRIVAREAADARAASTASGRPTPTATTSSSTRTTRAASELARFHMLRQQEPIADGRPNRSLADFVAPTRLAGAGLPRRVRRHGRHRRRRARRRSTKRSTTTTARSSSRRSPIGWPRRSPSTCTRRRARTGATARTRRSSPTI